MRIIKSLTSISLWFTISVMMYGGTRTVTLNSLEIGLDERSGCIVSMSHPKTGLLLKSDASGAGIIDLAYPLETFVPMRLEANYSKARIVEIENGVKIIWNRLSPNRTNFELPDGFVSAVVEISAAKDGRSVIMKCRIENHSPIVIPQILFPDLHGLLPIAGTEDTELRFARGTVEPFSTPIRAPDSAPFYAEKGDDRGWVHYGAAGYYGSFGLRWLDYGSLRSGISIFHKAWAIPNKPGVRTFRSESQPLELRLLWDFEDMQIDAGGTWLSGEFWFTPHRGGWAKGIEVFRGYVADVNPHRTIPQHVAEEIGFRSIWMIQPLERDPARAAFLFRDLPAVARDALEHGLSEISAWGVTNYFDLPIILRPELGSRSEFLAALEKTRQMGANIAPYFSVQTIANMTLVKKYGVIPRSENWTYGLDFVPYFRPDYTKAAEGSWIDSGNKTWQEDIRKELSRWIDSGVYSFGWDQFTNRKGPNPGKHEVSGFLDIIEGLRKQIRETDPSSTFYSESNSPYSLEEDGRVVDYTWNWTDYTDATPILNVMKHPRLNCNVEDSVLVVKKGFCDGLYLNVMPRKPDQPNGTALIADFPELSSALKTVAKLRRHFLPYFTEGIAIGNCVLSEKVDAFVSAHLLKNKLLIFVLNDLPQAHSVDLRSDLSLWLPAERPFYARYYNEELDILSEEYQNDQRWIGMTKRLDPLELAILEITDQETKE